MEDGFDIEGGVGRARAQREYDEEQQRIQDAQQLQDLFAADPRYAELMFPGMSSQDLTFQTEGSSLGDVGYYITPNNELTYLFNPTIAQYAKSNAGLGYDFNPQTISAIGDGSPSDILAGKQYVSPSEVGNYERAMQEYRKWQSQQSHGWGEFLPSIFTTLASWGIGSSLAGPASSSLGLKPGVAATQALGPGTSSIGLNASTFGGIGSGLIPGAVSAGATLPSLKDVYNASQTPFAKGYSSLKTGINAAKTVGNLLDGTSSLGLKPDFGGLGLRPSAPGRMDSGSGGLDLLFGGSRRIPRGRL